MMMRGKFAISSYFWNELECLQDRWNTFKTDENGMYSGNMSYTEFAKLYLQKYASI